MWTTSSLTTANAHLCIIQVNRIYAINMNNINLSSWSQRLYHHLSPFPGGDFHWFVVQLLELIALEKLGEFDGFIVVQDVPTHPNPSQFLIDRPYRIRFSQEAQLPVPSFGLRINDHTHAHTRLSQLEHPEDDVQLVFGPARV